MKDNYSDFIKKAYEAGRVKDSSEAFKDYPPEEEWHHGDAISLIGESKVEYLSKYSIGDIVYVKEFLFPDGSIGYNHLFVIIDDNNISVPLDYFGFIISSRLNKLKYDSNVLLKKDSLNNLSKDSIVKTDCVYKISSDNILFKIGSVSRSNVIRYKNMFLSK